MASTELHLQSQNISFIFLIISFLILGILYAFHYKYAKSLILSAFGQRYANQYLRDENIFKRQVNMLFTCLMILNISIFIWSIQESFSESIISLLAVIFFVLAYYVIKYLCLHFLGAILKMNQIAVIAIFFTTLFDKIFALFCFPCLLFFHFFIINLQEYFMYLMVGFFILFLILKMFWIFRVGIKSFGLSRFYLFIYICTLEFFPLLLLARRVFFGEL